MRMRRAGGGNGRQATPRRASALLAVSATLSAAAGGCGADASASRPGSDAAASTPSGSRLADTATAGERGGPPLEGTTERPAATVAGVGLVSDGPPPAPATSAACIERWNGSANTVGRRAALTGVVSPQGALVRIGKRTDYFDAVGRCVVWIVAAGQPNFAIVLAERAAGVFQPRGGASRLLVEPDLAVDGDGRIVAP